jgi:hypothetical protein
MSYLSRVFQSCERSPTLLKKLDEIPTYVSSNFFYNVRYLCFTWASCLCILSLKYKISIPLSCVPSLELSQFFTWAMLGSAWASSIQFCCLLHPELFLAVLFPWATVSPLPWAISASFLTAARRRPAGNDRSPGPVTGPEPTPPPPVRHAGRVFPYKSCPSFSFFFSRPSALLSMFTSSYQNMHFFTQNTCHSPCSHPPPSPRHPQDPPATPSDDGHLPLLIRLVDGTSIFIGIFSIGRGI